MKNTDGLSLQTLRRLPGYYNFIQAAIRSGEASVSAAAIARRFGLNEVQVRKDLAAVSSVPGKPRTGFAAEALKNDIADYLGYNNMDDAVLVGAGRLGRALLSYTGFEENGVRIVAGFDRDAKRIGETVGGKPVLSIDKLPNLCRRMNAHIGIITVPGPAAQQVCDVMVASGILAIWNFAPVHLVAPPRVLVQNENMAVSLTLLSQHLAERIKGEEETKGRHIGDL